MKLTDEIIGSAIIAKGAKSCALQEWVRDGFTYRVVIGDRLRVYERTARRATIIAHRGAMVA